MVEQQRGCFMAILRQLQILFTPMCQRRRSGAVVDCGILPEHNGPQFGVRRSTVFEAIR